MATAEAMSPFTDWLESEMAPRKLNKAQVAAAIETSDSTISAWFKIPGRNPNSDMCRRLADYFHVPVQDVLKAAGHLAESEPGAQPSAIPEWVWSELEGLGLTKGEYEVVVETARGLLRLRAERAGNEARR